MTGAHDDALDRWLAALEARHLADLRIPEVTRALRALSALYVERRHRADDRNPPQGTASRAPVRATLDTTGKRAAFALFYAPLHFITTARVIRALGAAIPAPGRIVDFGCGTGAAGAAWALEADRVPGVLGLERHPWAVDEARWTYRQLGVQGGARQADVTRPVRVRAQDAVVAGWVLNELPQEARLRVEQRMLAAAAGGARVLVLEPIARSVAPWWNETADRVTAAGGRADEWRFQAELPPLLRMFDKAAGLDHRELKVRSLYIG